MTLHLYIKVVFRRAFWRTPSLGDGFVAIVGAGAGAISHYAPAYETIIASYLWQVPFWGIALAAIYRLMTAPYFVWRDELSRADIAERSLVDYFEKNGFDQTYRKDLAAKAMLMRERLATRQHSISGVTDNYLAALWDFEQRGEIYDDFHKRTFEKF